MEVEQFQKKLWKVRKTGIDVVVGVWVGSRREDYLVPVDQGVEGEMLAHCFCEAGEQENDLGLAGLCNLCL